MGTNLALFCPLKWAHLGQMPQIQISWIQEIWCNQYYHLIEGYQNFNKNGEELPVVSSWTMRLHTLRETISSLFQGVNSHDFLEAIFKIFCDFFWIVAIIIFLCIFFSKRINSWKYWIHILSSFEDIYIFCFVYIIRLEFRDPQKCIVRVL